MQKGRYIQDRSTSIGAYFKVTLSLSLSSLLFCKAFAPLSSLLNSRSYGYTTSTRTTFHLFYMDDLETFGKHDQGQTGLHLKQENKKKKLVCMTFLWLIALTNKMFAHISLPSRSKKQTAASVETVEFKNRCTVTWSQSSPLCRKQRKSGITFLSLKVQNKPGWLSSYLAE